MTRVSILVPLYNTAPFIKETIKSILAQTYTDWEVLILDNCSSDQSFEIAQSLAQKDKRIKVLRNEKKLSLINHWNKGLDLCQSEFFVKLDAGDRWHPQILARSLEVMDKHPQVGLVFTNFAKIDELGNLIKDSYAHMPKFACNQSFSCLKLVKLGAEYMLSYDIPRLGIALTRRELYHKLGNYIDLRLANEEFYFRVGAYYEVYGIDQNYYYWRQHPQSAYQKIQEEGSWPLHLYQLRNRIINYYYKNSKITKAEKEKNLKITQYIWNTNRVYEARLHKQFGKMLRIMLSMFWHTPQYASKYYLKRIGNYIKPSFIFSNIQSLKEASGTNPEKVRKKRYKKKRLKTIQNYLHTHSIRKLHIGAQYQFLEGWLDADIEPCSEDSIYMDATQPFPFEDKTFDYIFSEHMIEHISLEEGIFMLKECYRVLKPNGMIRISTPDLEFLINLYQHQDKDIHQAYMQFSHDRYFAHLPAMKGIVLNNFVRDWGHQFIYDFETLEFALSQVNFTEITRQKVGESQDSQLAQLEQHGNEIGETFNLLESIVVEARK